MPSPFFAVAGSGIVYKGADGSTLQVPELPGLAASLTNGKVTDAALAKNKGVDVWREDATSLVGYEISDDSVSRLLTDAIAHESELMFPWR